MAQATSGADHALEERRADPKRRVRHHCECRARETEIGRVSANDRYVALIEVISQTRNALWTQLNCNNAYTGRDERTTCRCSSRSDVETKATGNDASACNAARKTTIELMPPPPPPWPADRGHGAPSPSNNSWCDRNQFPQARHPPRQRGRLHLHVRRPARHERGDGARNPPISRAWIVLGGRTDQPMRRGLAAKDRCAIGDDEAVMLL